VTNVQEEEVQKIFLNDQQIDYIINYAVEKGLYDGEPPAPEEKDRRRTDAATLVYQARRARDNGNTSPEVKEIVFVADVDQKPAQADSIAAFAPPSQAPVLPAVAPGDENGITDISGASDEDLQKIIEGLTPNSQIAAVSAEIERCKAELERRRGAQGQVQQEAPPPAQAPAIPPSPPQIPAQPVAPPSVAPPVLSAGGVLPPGATDAEGHLRLRVDAPVDTAPEAPGAGAEGSADEAEEDAQARRRNELEAQVSGQLLIAYGKTFADVASIPTEDLERMVANPGGPQPETQRIEATEITPERAKLEEQVTGPMLKAWKRGRVDVVGLSDEELAEMVSYPEGPPQDAQQAPTAPPLPPAPSVVPQSSPPVVPVPAPQVAVGAPVVPVVPQSGVDELIQREKLPLPSEIENPPALPFDISKISDEELRSVHAQFGAVLARANWVIAEAKDQIFVSERALAVRKVEVRDSLPKMTKDDAAAKVAADEEVLRLEAEIAEKSRPLIKLEVIAENARRAVAHASREFAMRYREEDPTRRGTA
jgi:hypothetical protein